MAEVYYQLGDTPYIRSLHEVYDFSTDTWSETDPDDGYPKITIISPSGDTLVNAAVMTKVTTGRYEYQYPLALDAETGRYRGFVEVEIGGNPNRKYFTFIVERKTE
jgi:uncharacterized protein YfaS (alpha-2-macroglobulin family)